MSDTLPLRREYPADSGISTWFAGDGWPIRRFDREGSGRGQLLFVGGRGDTIEKYLESLDDWHARGWSVTAFDWRGQGGSGRLSRDRHVGHATDFARFVDDLGRFWGDWGRAKAGSQPANGSVRVVIGHSMGGHLVLRAMAERRIDPEAAVLVAPMLGLRSPVGSWLGGLGARIWRDRGDPARAAWKGHERPGARLDRRALLTHDAARYSDEAWWLERKPELRLGPPSWAWVAEAFASTAALRRDPRLGGIAAPVLMLLADQDRLMSARAALAVAAGLRDVEIVRFGADCAHEILRETDDVRGRALAAIDAFLDSRVPPR